MSLALVAASHTPLFNRGPATAGTKGRIEAAFKQLANWVRRFEPDYIVQFSPDHFNSFFYDLLPPFCVGAGAVSIGDWGGGKGSLPVPESTALDLLDHVRSDEFDVALSYRMPVDHGFVQMWEVMFGGFRSIPIVPLFVNGAAPPLPSYRRSRLLGESVGRFAARSGKRVLLAASGGLSHDPPLPDIRTASAEVREGLIGGRNPTSEARDARERRVLEAGTLAEAGEGPCQPLNPEWDRNFLDMLRTGDFRGIDALEPEEVRRVAGRGANETLSWVAAFGALAAVGPYKFDQEFYEAIPGWIAGMATVAARSI